MYNKLDHNIVRDLTGIVGNDNIILDTDAMEPYSHDESPCLKIVPEAVVRPSDISQVKEIVLLANRDNFPVTPRGGGTALTGGSLAAHGGVIISFELLNSILDMDTASRTAVIEPGVINGILQEKAREASLFYPVNPASMDSCTIGGNAAQSTGGANTVRYGTTRNYITGMEAVTGNSELWNAGGSIVKNSTDNLLIQLMCGSEGTLSVFTKLYVRLLREPSFTVWLIAPFEDIKKIPAAADEIFKLGFNPTMVELMDSATITCCSSYLDTPIQYSDLNQLLIRYDSEDNLMLDSITERTGMICSSLGAKDILLADSRKDQDKIWKIRSSIHDALAKESRSVCEEDIVVPVSSVNVLISSLQSLGRESGYRLFLFGHLGDGNMHVNFASGDKAVFTVEKLRLRILSLAAELGGKISGEHGIGMHKRSFFRTMTDPVYMKMLSRIKKEFDRSNILNPGKLMDFPDLH